MLSTEAQNLNKLGMSTTNKERSIMNNYHELVREILDYGVKQPDRTGDGTIRKFGMRIDFDLRDGFPILETKKTSFKNIIVELMWFLSGSTKVCDLWKHDVHIWDGDLVRFKEDQIKSLIELNELTEIKTKEEILGYLKKNGVKLNADLDTWEAREKTSLGSIYGEFWGQQRWIWSALDTIVDELDEHGSLHLISNESKSLLRRLIVNAWVPETNTNLKNKISALPPCHVMFQLGLEQHGDTIFIDMEMYQRSADVFLGLPYNITSYATLMEIIAYIMTIRGEKITFVPRNLGITIGDAHIYNSHVEQAKELLARWDSPNDAIEIEHSYVVPRLTHRFKEKYNKPSLQQTFNSIDLQGDKSTSMGYVIDDKYSITIVNYRPQEAIKAPLQVGQ